MMPTEIEDPWSTRLWVKGAQAVHTGRSGHRGGEEPRAPTGADRFGGSCPAHVGLPRSRAATSGHHHDQPTVRTLIDQRLRKRLDQVGIRLAPGPEVGDRARLHKAAALVAEQDVQRTAPPVPHGHHQVDDVVEQRGIGHRPLRPVLGKVLKGHALQGGANAGPPVEVIHRGTRIPPAGPDLPGDDVPYACAQEPAAISARGSTQQTCSKASGPLPPESRCCPPQPPPP